jgi:hypothetical protein
MRTLPGAMLLLEEGREAAAKEWQFAAQQAETPPKVRSARACA